MCGIIGYCGIPIKPISEKEMSFARSLLIHRGPDDEGYYFDENIGLGHRRLSIIDLKTGKQPFHSFDNRFAIIFNGEIYNYKQVQSQLIQKGYKFITTSDTEVLLNAFIEWGKDALNKLNGMFAFAIWNKNDKELFIARDRLGKKPLYYFHTKNFFAFSSEIKALLALPGIPKELDFQGLWNYLSFRFVPGPISVFKNIYKLEPGNFLTFSQNTGLKVQQYWFFPLENKPASNKPIHEIQEEFDTLFEDACQKRLVADVPVGILLSGGLDSSAVMTACRNANIGRMASFSIGFTGNKFYDETPYAELVSRHLGTEHHHIKIGKEQFTSLLDKFVYHTDEPLADLASIPLFFVCELASKHVKVVLSGEGSDELLGGYEFGRLQSLLDISQSLQHIPGISKLAFLLEKLPVGSIARYASYLKKYNQNYIADNLIDMTSHQYFSEAEKNHIMPQLKELIKSRESIIKPLYDQAKACSPLNQLLYVISKTWLVEDLLMKADKMSMANSIELRVPFLDYRLVEFVSALPSNFKVRKDPSGEYITKYLLRKYAEKKLPPNIITRKKQGFPVPAYGWLKNGLNDFARDILFEQKGFIMQFMNHKAVEDLWNKRKAARAQHQIWALIILTLWYKAYFISPQK